jgi:23S rRNA (guanosine2251-2'-O)-methyltransferase
MIIYGINSVLEALRAGRVREMRVAGRADDRLRDVLELASARGVRVGHVTPEALDADAQGGSHQGVVAEVTPLPPASLEDLARAKEGGDPPLIVVLDGVEDPQNVGAIIRSVDAAGGTGLVRQTRRAAPLTGAAAKASAGAVHHVPVADVVNIARALEELKQLGVWTVGLDADAETSYYGLDLTPPIALVVGAEGHGLRRLVRERCDFVAAIPLAGHVSSLNVSAATAIVLFEAVRQRRSSGPPPRVSQRGGDGSRRRP